MFDYNASVQINFSSYNVMLLFWLKWIETGVFVQSSKPMFTATSRTGLLQAEKDRYMKKLELESERTSQLRRQISSEERKDQEICDLHQQLSDLQVLWC